MSSRNFSFDVLRALATVSVVALHVAGPVLYEYRALPAGEWWAANAIDSAVRFSVPVFLMLTGALLLPKVEPTGQFLKRRFVRLLGPFVFWSIVYLGVAMYFTTAGPSLIGFLVKRLQTGASFHLWYVYMLIGIYLLLPVMQRWVAGADRRNLEYFLLLWLVALFASRPFVAAYLPDFNLVYFSGYVGYPVLGYYLNRYFLESKLQDETAFSREKAVAGNNGEQPVPAAAGLSGSGGGAAQPPGSSRFVTRMALFLLISGFLITFIGTGRISASRNAFDQTFYEYLSFNVIAMAVGVFLLVGKIGKEGVPETPLSLKHRLPRTVVVVVSRYSYGIYLSHIFVLKMATFLQWDLLIKKLSGGETSGLAETAMALHPAVGIPLLTVATTLVALGITVGLSKLPGGKYIAG
jgi:surface polysaccharide O-acyltransferase-like enzyme